MDISKAMALLGFSSCRTFESTCLDEIQRSFTKRVHHLEMLKTNPKMQQQMTEMFKQEMDKCDELRKVSEAYQYLNKKVMLRSSFAGGVPGSVSESWQLSGIKTKAIRNLMAMQQQTRLTEEEKLAENNPLQAVLKRNEEAMNMPHRTRRRSSSSETGSSIIASAVAAGSISTTRKFDLSSNYMEELRALETTPSPLPPPLVGTDRKRNISWKRSRPRNQKDDSRSSRSVARLHSDPIFFLPRAANPLSATSNLISHNPPRTSASALRTMLHPPPALILPRTQKIASKSRLTSANSSSSSSAPRRLKKKKSRSGSEKRPQNGLDEDFSGVKYTNVDLNKAVVKAFSKMELNGPSSPDPDATKYGDAVATERGSDKKKVLLKKKKRKRTNNE
jgi:hypothetical protein